MKESGPDDASLLMMIAQARAEALDTLYERYNRLLFSISLSILGDPALAEEVTLDVFVHVWRRAGTYQPEKGKVSTWLIAITRNRAIDMLRWYGSRPEATSLSPDEAPVPADARRREPEEHLELSLERERVQRAVAELPPDQRKALALAFFKGYTHRQIAEALDQPLGTIKTRIRLAMRSLRERLAEE
jgi:RNA polymerase sigma-70 factor (ECF subfamily)